VVKANLPHGVGCLFIAAPARLCFFQVPTEDKKQEERKQRLLRAELEAFMGRSGMSIDGLAMGMSPEMAIRAARMKGKNTTSIRVSLK